MADLHRRRHGTCVGAEWTRAVLPPVLLFEGRYEFGQGEPGYDVTPDGQRFLMIKAEEAATTTPLVVVQEWTRELDRLDAYEKIGAFDPRLCQTRDSGIVGNITTTMKKPDQLVSAADANRRFSELLRGVREGRSFVVTTHGKPVAKLVPAGKDDSKAAGARKVLLSRLRDEPIVQIGRWTRDELYEDGS